MKSIFISLVVLLILCSIGTAQYRCDWYSFSNGSGNLQSTNYKTLSTVNQTAIGNLTSSNILAYIGFWTPGILVGIMEEKNDEINQTNPLITKLYSAFPNPFKAQTQIRYSLSAKSKVLLLVHDITGRIVANLVNEQKDAGVYTLNWNGRNNQAQKLSNGVYFYTLRTDNYAKTNKIVLTD